jgi:rhodanese-related sulfurtransferase
MRVERFMLKALGHCSYLVVDGTSRTAAVIDPHPDPAPLLARCAALGCAPRFVFVTEPPRDFEPGHAALLERGGGFAYAGRASGPLPGTTAVQSGDVIEFGRTRLTVLETPSHRPDSISLLYHDLAMSAVDPTAVFCGRLLSPGDVERPDPEAWRGVPPDQVSRVYHRSLHGILQVLPPWTLLFSARDLGGGNGSIVEVERRRNHAARAGSRAGLAGILWPDGIPERSGPGGLRAASADELCRAEAQVVDVRTPQDFAAGHVRGSVSLALSESFEESARAALDPARAVLLVADREDETEAARRLAAAGIDPVAGVLEGGMMALAERPEAVAALERRTAAELARRPLPDEDLVTLDVRGPAERAAGTVPASLRVPLDRLLARAPELPRDAELVLLSASSARSTTAASLLRRAGRARVSVLVGGQAAWNQSRPQARVNS